ncbi:hypothetical protein DRO64_02030 [Candidatus Bathyarchaeota archaeon]|nr:MAG: hypothetical protein DRO64_02030 [Candidatus Bathyarchaeota archaeon]
MKPIDRVISTLYHEEPDMVPLAEEFMTREAERLFVGESVEREISSLKRRLLIARWWGNDIITVGGNAPDLISEVLVQDEKNGYVITKRAYGSIDFMREKPYFYKVLHSPVRYPEDLDRIIPPDIEDFKPAVESLAREVRWFKDRGYFVESFHNGPYVMVWQFLRGLKQFLMDIVRDPEFAKKLVEFAMKPQIEVSKMIIDEAKVDAIRIGGDMGTSESLMFSPKAYKEIFHPWLKRLVDEYHKRGVFVFRHCHGNINLIFEDMVNAGFDSIDPLDPHDGMDLHEIKEKYGERITLRGGISSHIGTYSKKQIYKHLAEVLNIGAPGGGYILMSAGQIPPDMPVENVLYYRELINKIRRYHLK